MSGDWAFESIFHFTVNATNFERSLAFYQALGFQLLRDNRDVVWPPLVAENFGMKRAQGRGALLAIGPEPHHVRIDLLEWLEPRWEGPRSDVPEDERVPRVIAIRTRNVRAAYADLSARGIAFVREPHAPDPARHRRGRLLSRPGRNADRADRIRARRARIAHRPPAEALTRTARSG